MRDSYKKYIPAKKITLHNREWPNKQVTSAPIWCSVDLRDGNQALVNPMTLSEKLEFFKMLVKIGIKEIEVGFPSASATEYETLRALADGGLIPDDVTVQVIVQAREHLIKKTFESIEGIKNVIVHLYVPISEGQRKVVFDTDFEGVADISVNAMRLFKELGSKLEDKGANVTYEYSPEGFSDSDMDEAVKICQRVIEESGATPQKKMIINLPTTVERTMPNVFADQVEYFCKSLPGRDSAIISIHPHNDRGTGVASAEMALLAGAERVEGTIFGNGERTGNLDIVNLAMNMHLEGIDTGLDFSDIKGVRKIYERVTKMHLSERHPYVGDLVFTAFSGSHQDAISKGIKYMRESGSPYWQVPYLLIDPADIGREYEPIIRISSQSGKGGAAFIMQSSYGYDLPKSMHPEFGAVVQAESERNGAEITAEKVFELFKREYIDVKQYYRLLQYKFSEETRNEPDTHVTFEGTLNCLGEKKLIRGEGNGPLDAFFNAVHGLDIDRYIFKSYSEHAVTSGSDSQAVAYVELENPKGKAVFGVGMSHNINIAPIRAIICAINRDIRMRDET